MLLIDSAREAAQRHTARVGSPQLHKHSVASKTSPHWKSLLAFVGLAAILADDPKVRSHLFLRALKLNLSSWRHRLTTIYIRRRRFMLCIHFACSCLFCMLFWGVTAYIRSLVLCFHSLLGHWHRLATALFRTAGKDVFEDS